MLKDSFGISVKNTPGNTQQNLHLKFAVDQSNLLNQNN